VPKSICVPSPKSISCSCLRRVMGRIHQPGGALLSQQNRLLESKNEVAKATNIVKPLLCLRSCLRSSRAFRPEPRGAPPLLPPPPSPPPPWTTRTKMRQLVLLRRRLHGRRWRRKKTSFESLPRTPTEKRPKQKQTKTPGSARLFPPRNGNWREVDQKNGRACVLVLIFVSWRKAQMYGVCRVCFLPPAAYPGRESI
jgi:hypothetical protein